MMPLLNRVLTSVPVFPGKARLAETLGGLGARWGDGLAVAQPASGVRLEVDLRDRIQRQMWGACFEPHVRACIEALLGPGEVFLDVGANIGYHAAIAAQLVGPRGTVHAFEADGELHRRLEHNLAAFPWATAHACAVWDVSGSLVFERSPDPTESGWGTLAAVWDRGTGERSTVRATSLDDWMDAAHPPAVRMIKIDAEGAEMAILRGATRLLKRFSPALILEANDILLRRAGTSAADIAAHLAAAGYRNWLLERRQLAHWDANARDTFADVLAVPHARVDETLAALRHAGWKA